MRILTAERITSQSEKYTITVFISGKATSMDLWSDVFVHRIDKSICIISVSASKDTDTFKDDCKINIKTGC